MHTDPQAAAAPLSITFGAPGRATIALTGNLTKELLPALEASISVAETQIKTAAAADQLRIFLDMSQFGGVYDVECLQAMADFAKRNAPFVAKTAVVGGPETGAMAAEVAAALAGRENIQTFPTRAEAEAWLDGQA